MFDGDFTTAVRLLGSSCEYVTNTPPFLWRSHGLGFSGWNLLHVDLRTEDGPWVGII